MGVDTSAYILNAVPSAGTDTDWRFEDAVAAEVVRDGAPPAECDLREAWWPPSNQGDTGACVGFAAADGVLRWHFVQKGWIRENLDDRPSPRFIWMANKETDEITSYPTTFIDTAGTQTKLALKVARRYGCAQERDLPIDGGYSSMAAAAFYTRAARLRIASYHKLGADLVHWRKWLAFNGPILTRLNVDRTWDVATENEGRLDEYDGETVRGGHAVCIVGYTPDRFIIRNSWGEEWGDGGFAYASEDYARAAFQDDTYGTVL